MMLALFEVKRNRKNKIMLDKVKFLCFSIYFTIERPLKLLLLLILTLIFIDWYTLRTNIKEAEGSRIILVKGEPLAIDFSNKKVYQCMGCHPLWQPAPIECLHKKEIRILIDENKKGIYEETK